MEGWPRTREELIEEQLRLAALERDPWRFESGARVGGVFVCFARGGSGPGHAGDPASAAACVDEQSVVLAGRAGAPYGAGLLALREGALLEAAVHALPAQPDVLLVEATGSDHPRRAGLALQLGELLDLPTVGVTHRPLVAKGEWPADERGARSPLYLEGELVGYWLRTRAGTRPLAVHAARRTDPDTAAKVVLRNQPSAHAGTPARSAPPSPRSPGGCPGTLGAASRALVRSSSRLARQLVCGKRPKERMRGVIRPLRQSSAQKRRVLRLRNVRGFQGSSPSKALRLLRKGRQCLEHSLGQVA